MKNTNNVKKQLFTALIQSILTFTLIPGITFIFTLYVIKSYRLRGGEMAQFYGMYTLSYWLLIGGVLLFLFIIALGAIAFTNRKAQYISFITGWRLLMLSCIIELIAQGVIVIWLSYWLTAIFFNSYAPKLILVVALLIGGGILFALIAMFKRLPQNNTIEGELLSRIDAPALWSRVDHIAKKLNTKAPDQIIAGIDTNFFVTQSNTTLNGKKLKGRTLFISIPLLRLLTTDEADSVLAHELNHLRGGDTANSAALYPKLLHCNNYINEMHGNAATYIVYYPLHLYRLIFEVALQRESRIREFMADKTAAQTVSPQAIVNSLIKIEAYAAYRAQTENQLWNQNQCHNGNIGIAARIAQGIADYVRSENFLQDMKHANIPHPFDSHPALIDRMDNVKYKVTPDNFAHIVTQTPVTTWVDNIPTAQQIETQLWSKYEQQFEQDHELNLAYRYEPANAEQEQIVLKYFPAVSFALKKEQSVQITYQGIVAPDSTLYKWEDIKETNYIDGFSTDILTLTFLEKKLIGHKKQTIKLPGIKAERQELKAAIGKYWQRHDIMVAMQKEEQQKQQTNGMSQPTT